MNRVVHFGDKVDGALVAHAANKLLQTQAPIGEEGRCGEIMSDTGPRQALPTRKHLQLGTDAQLTLRGAQRVRRVPGQKESRLHMSQESLVPAGIGLHEHRPRLPNQVKAELTRLTGEVKVNGQLAQARFNRPSATEPPRIQEIFWAQMKDIRATPQRTFAS
jgi:hypothetical protein